MIGVGLIGSGGVARTRCANIAASPDARLVAIASRNPATGAALAVANGCAYEDDAETMLRRPDVDAVIVCTHNASHGSLAGASLAAGKHLLVEYPLALSTVEADAALVMARERELALRVGYDQQYLGPHAAIREMIHERGMPFAARIVVSSAASASAAFRSLATGGTPGQVKPYYLYALLDWLGPPLARSTRSVVAAEGPAGRYGSGVQTADLSYAGTLAQIMWMVGGVVQGRQQIRIDMHWTGLSVHADGRAVTMSSAAGEQALPVQRMPWTEATGLGLAVFLADCQSDVPSLDHAERAAETVRILDQR